MNRIFVSSLLCVVILCVPHPPYAQEANKGVSKISFCEVFDGSDSFDGKLVITEALMTYSTVSRVDGGDSFLYSPKCNNQDFFAVTEFSDGITKTVKQFFSKLPDERNFVLKVTLTGRARSSFIPLFGHLSWSRSQFVVEDINNISNITNDSSHVPPNFDDEAPLTELGNHLRNLNSDLVLSLLTGLAPEKLNDSLDPAFGLTDPNGRTFSGDRLRLLSLEYIFGKVDGFETRAVQQPKVKVVGQDHIATGLFWIENAARDRKQLEYENVFRQSGSTFILVRTRLRSIPK